MKSNSDIIKAGPFEASTSTISNANRLEFLRISTERMATILAAHGMSLRITLDGSTLVIGDNISSNGDPVEFIFSSKAVFTRLFLLLRLNKFVMAYFDGQLQVRGSLSKAVDVLYAMNLETDRRQSIGEFCLALLTRGIKIAIPASARRFESLEHYSQSAQAYELFLDRYMQYTCGHFPQGDENIDQAQVAKFELIKKLLARHHFGPMTNKEHLDIGCGWGGMMAYFQNNCDMRSLGNTNCARQMEYAQRRYGADIFFGDFLDLKRCPKRFDLITIVGMIEHLNPYRRTQLLNVVARLLKPGGFVYLQCITKPRTWVGGDVYRVTKREIFPGHFLETREQTEARLTSCGFSILEQLEGRHDYALTTERWVDKIEKNESALTELLGARQYRMYLGYLSFARKLFSIEGRGSLMRYVLKKP